MVAARRELNGKARIPAGSRGHNQPITSSNSAASEDELLEHESPVAADGMGIAGLGTYDEYLGTFVRRRNCDPACADVEKLQAIRRLPLSYKE
jgi:hypothetical protein